MSDSSHSSDLSEIPFEESLKELEGIVQKISSGDLSLEELITNHEKATRLLASCQESLDRAKGRIQLIETTAGREPMFKDFKQTESAPELTS